LFSIHPGLHLETARMGGFFYEESPYFILFIFPPPLEHISHITKNDKGH